MGHTQTRVSDGFLGAVFDRGYITQVHRPSLSGTGANRLVNPDDNIAHIQGGTKEGIRRNHKFTVKLGEMSGRDRGISRGQSPLHFQGRNPISGHAARVQFHANFPPAAAGDISPGNIFHLGQPG